MTPRLEAFSDVTHRGRRESHLLATSAAPRPLAPGQWAELAVDATPREGRQDVVLVVTSAPFSGDFQRRRIRDVTLEYAE